MNKKKKNNNNKRKEYVCVKLKIKNEMWKKSKSKN